MIGKNSFKHHYLKIKSFTNITDPDYKDAKRSWEERRIKNLVEYYNSYIQSDTFLLADVFDDLENKCIEIFELDLPYFFSAPGLAWQAAFKNEKVRLELLTDINMLLMVMLLVDVEKILNTWKIMIKKRIIKCYVLGFE